jgi:hypothetical protein
VIWVTAPVIDQKYVNFTPSCCQQHNLLVANLLKCTTVGHHTSLLESQKNARNLNRQQVILFLFGLNAFIFILVVAVLRIMWKKKAGKKFHLLGSETVFRKEKRFMKILTFAIPVGIP